MGPTRDHSDGSSDHYRDGGHPGPQASRSGSANPLGTNDELPAIPNYVTTNDHACTADLCSSNNLLCSTNYLCSSNNVLWSYANHLLWWLWRWHGRRLWRRKHHWR